MTPLRAAAVVIASTRAAAGTYEDECGPAIAAWLYDHGFAVADAVIVPDGDAVGAAIGRALEARPAVLITSGGTGLSPDDATPEQTAPYLTRSLPGIVEAIRSAGAATIPTAVLSRGLAGTAGTTFVLNLPGSPGGVRDGLAVLSPLIHHICSQLEGTNDHR
ncbi:MogA/MoaB family molybdenum cofactor biosynthesis protein [Arthrobacter agilis]|uniref:MogA/MoaB family molybdenum cofactor biosynthesis protein n=1 Tax=Arthrobacter agilis TaxID=37921 RepID=UPI000B34E85F|nr:MogA/MoaB family molybdenum cofactor biosynthesis protein [Arthrobacter agilis]OUM40358.1 molybdenum cofactor biosynthesis protein [Arthrobacter agilis]PPB44972.1 molybdenum cofactor biosynthesis protein [Arthrobacter agilis]TPV27675.1 MogA/MoaB family molybdenum cofactor biosynthesis protein [Arthrobacter agilis]VDR31692.1 Molybdopterin adenylyltransferase [Arthrobacter agilis]